MSLKPLRVELQNFCRQFSEILQPFADNLENCLGNLRQQEDGEDFKSVLNALLDTRNRLKILQDKAHQQHAYLLIFGPLKSGKSTLMNAISGSYVSEVSSLPAYPCLVYVHEGEERRFAITDFNGEETLYPSPHALNASVQSAHEQLARKIREADQTNEPFNPAEEFKEAIRRIDLTLPAPYLRESGTIIVDTPGLYAKMKYNYGQLTRDFRDTAACAVFVVKTDNLFFERVFEEFADLLNIFSRVFLVVNIDSRKQDLDPDGNLIPSLEQQNPEKIIEAFENLTVSAQIRSSIESGQLRIYAIDLLETARQSLQTDKEAVAETYSHNREQDEPAEDPPVEETESAADEKPSTGAPWDVPASGEESRLPSSLGAAKIGFPAFLKDLTDYLNSSDYLIEFMGDSLRQTHSIIREIGDQTSSSGMIACRESIEELKQNAERSERQLEEVRQLQEDAWDSPLDELEREMQQQVEEHTGSAIAPLKKSVHAELDIWYFTDESVQHLMRERIQPLIRKACADSRERAKDLITAYCEGHTGGVRLSTELVGRMQNIGLEFDDIFPQFKDALARDLSEQPVLPDPDNIQETIPVRKGFLDHLLFRSPGRIRRRIFGEENPSPQVIPAATKSRRFGEEGKSALYDMADHHVERSFQELVQDSVQQILRQYSDFFRQQTAERLEKKAAELKKEGDLARRRFEHRRNVLESMDSLESSSETLMEEVESLRERFVSGKTAGGEEAPAGEAPRQNGNSSSEH